MTPEPKDSRWWLLIHQLPPKPAYLRVKVARQLRRIGAVAVKNTVYVLPGTDTAREDFQWVQTQVLEGGGEALVCDARFVEGMSDDQVRTLFCDERDADYALIAKDARQLSSSHKRLDKTEKREALEAGVGRLERRLQETAEIDFFDAPGRSVAQDLVEGLRRRLRNDRPKDESKPKQKSLEDWRGRTWVTRTGVKVDRIASAWLVRRFIDERASFKFVSGKGYQPTSGEVRFDMFEAEFTHEGDLCTFEVLMQRFGIECRGLKPIAEIVHDLDIKDAKYERPETRGVAALIEGLVSTCPDDEDRLERGFPLFDCLLASLATSKSAH